MSISTALFILFYFAAGAGLGLVYFSLLMNSVKRYVETDSFKKALPFYMLRVGLAVVSFGLLARQGALPLLLALSGFMTGRFLVQYSERFHA